MSTIIYREFTEDTELLTEEGWKLISDVDEDTKIAVVDEYLVTKYIKPTSVESREFQGLITNYTSNVNQGCNVSVTEGSVINMVPSDAEIIPFKRTLVSTEKFNDFKGLAFVSTSTNLLDEEDEDVFDATTALAIMLKYSSEHQEGMYSYNISNYPNELRLRVLEILDHVCVEYTLNEDGIVLFSLDGHDLIKNLGPYDFINSDISKLHSSFLFKALICWIDLHPLVSSIQEEDKCIISKVNGFNKEEVDIIQQIAVLTGNSVSVDLEANITIYFPFPNHVLKASDVVIINNPEYEGVVYAIDTEDGMIITRRDYRITVV